MYAVINFVCAGHDQPRRLFDRLVVPHRRARDGQPHAFDGRDLLTQFIVQFTRDGASLLLDARLHQLRQLAICRQRLCGLLGLQPGQSTALHRLGHRVERPSDLPSLATRQLGQAGFISATLHLLQATHDQSQRLGGPTDQGIHQRISQEKTSQHDPQHRAQIVPAVQRGARRVGQQRDAADGQVDDLGLEWRGHHARIPLRRLATHFVARRWRAIEQRSLLVVQSDLVGPHAAQSPQIRHRALHPARAAQTADVIVPVHVREQLQRDQMGAQHFVTD